MDSPVRTVVLSYAVTREPASAVAIENSVDRSRAGFYAHSDAWRTFPNGERGNAPRQTTLRETDAVGHTLGG